MSVSYVIEEETCIETELREARSWFIRNVEKKVEETDFVSYSKSLLGAR